MRHLNQEFAEEVYDDFNGNDGRGVTGPEY